MNQHTIEAGSGRNKRGLRVDEKQARTATDWSVHCLSRSESAKYTGCLKKNRDYGILYILHYKGWLYNRNYGFKYLYDKIYSIGYYSGFYSSMSDKI